MSQPPLSIYDMMKHAERVHGDAVSAIQAGQAHIQEFKLTLDDIAQTLGILRPATPSPSGESPAFTPVPAAGSGDIPPAPPRL
jgi:hypothetical protein